MSFSKWNISIMVSFSEMEISSINFRLFFLCFIFLKYIFINGEKADLGFKIQKIRRFPLDFYVIWNFIILMLISLIKNFKHN
jgi:hypothetical protein